MNNNLQGLIENWKERVSYNQQQHYEYAERLNKSHYVIGVIATIFVTVSGATILTDIQDPNIKAFVGVIGLIAAVLSAVQTFYSHGKRAELHRAAAASLGQVRREIELLEQFPPKKVADREKRIRDIQELISQVDQTAPIPVNITSGLGRANILNNLLLQVRNEPALKNIIAKSVERLMKK